jgi:sugar transferase (PEP-CTERM system associated)
MRIFNRYYSTYDLILVFGDVALTFCVMLGLQFTWSLAGVSPAGSWLFCIIQGGVMAAVIAISFYYADLYSIDQTLSVRELLLRFMSGFGTACIVIGLISYPIPQLGFKKVYASEMVLIGLVLSVWRAGFMRVLEQAKINAKVLIIGAQTIGKLVAEQLCQQKTLGMEVIGFVGAGSEPVTLTYGNPRKVSLPVFSPQSISSLVEKKGVNRILLAGGEVWGECAGDELIQLRIKGVPVEDCHSFYERLLSKIPITDLSPEWIVLAKGFRRDRVILFAKRVIDVVVSGLGLILSAPIALLTAILIKLDSPGPVLYRQERVGQDGARFVLLKFRSMTVDAESEQGPVWASVNDPRVTRVGRVIRKLRIDEIPQMINVLKGEMSFVGPRPERPFFVEKLKQKNRYYALRLSVKPGITGWAQISYRYGDSETDAVEKLQYDLYYIKNMSILFDVQIIFESLKVILLGKGAQ